MKKKCLIVSFDFTKPDYPNTSYSIASILAKFNDADIVDIEPYSYNLNNFLSTPKKEIEAIVRKEFQEKYLGIINDYSFIALATYAWSENLVNELIKIIRPKFDGKIILGGYEITAWSNEKLFQIYPDVDFYIKGYAEKALEKIFKNETNNIILNEKIDKDDIVSPYLSSILPLNTKKIHWESKRGCPYHCDYCEHGAVADKGSIIRISNDKLEKEIELFKEYNIQEINVLDATFLINKKDITTLEKLLTIPHCKICLQMHFTPVKGNIGKEFLDICQKHRDRISLEFGLQTIHEEEMNMLKRKNILNHVENVISQLNDNEINYSISIIFGIPSQTVESFRQTIEFIKNNNCEKFCAFPLQLPKNSKMRERMDELKIKEFQGEHFSLLFVSECYSFINSEWQEMYRIVESYGDKPPFCGDPIEFTKPIPEKIVYNYLRGGIHCKIRKEQKIGRSIFSL
ncbi:Ribosomal protein S12 methylthiotransferase RimO [termite gut metagenome]|uniref:Ribosomal protein S12 methylthiotransferase RimO n=1 Tax=termite gut metagenome TaxID=433724 RepID=A0A5J4SNF2_9ZZZZ